MFNKKGSLLVITIFSCILIILIKVFENLYIVNLMCFEWAGLPRNVNQFIECKNHSLEIVSNKIVTSKENASMLIQNLDLFRVKIKNVKLLNNFIILVIIIFNGYQLFKFFKMNNINKGVKND